MIHEVICPDDPIIDVKTIFNMAFMLRYVGVVQFVTHVLQLLLIRFTQQSFGALAYLQLKV